MKIKSILKLTVLCLLIFHSNQIFAQGDEDYADRKGYLTKVQISEEDKLKVFNDLWDSVNRRYFDPTFNGKDWSKIRQIYQPQVMAARDKMELVDIFNKMLGELNTSHLSVTYEIGISGGTLKKFFGKNINYKLNDILFDYGFSTSKFGSQMVVTQVDKTSSADEAGIKPGWIMKSCDYKTQSKKDGDSLIHSETAGCIFQNENGQESPLTLSKSFYLKPASVAQRSSKLLNDNILYLKFNEFDKDVDKWLKKEIANNPKARAVIIDVRDNVGGYVDELADSLSVFFPPQTLVGTSIERDLDEKTLRVGSNDSYKGKVAILINENSFSSAEIFASAFQEANRGKIIGQKSAGEVLAAVSKGLSNGLRLHIAVRDYKTAKGARLEGTGVTPDIEVPLTVEDFRQNRDITLERALEFLRN